VSRSPSSLRSRRPPVAGGSRCAGRRGADHVATNLRQLARGPLDGRAAKRALALLRGLAAGASITATEAALLAEHAALFSALGVDAEILGVARRALEEGVNEPRLATLAATHALVATPGGVELRLRSVAGESEADALRVVSAVMRGQLARAASMAKKRRYFTEFAEAPHVYATAYASWACALLDRSAEAVTIVATWERRHPDASPRARQFMLRVRGWIVGLGGDDAGELALAEEAALLCDEAGLHVERAFVDVELGFASLRGGDEQRALNIVSSFPRPGASAEGLLDAYRDLLRLEVALHRGEQSVARDAAMRAGVYYERTGNAVLACDALFGACLAEAWSHQADNALSAYRRAVHRSPTAGHQAKLRVLDGLGAALFDADARLHASRVSTSASAPAYAVHLFRPALEARHADLYLDDIRKQVWLSGRGPFRFGEHPVVELTLVTLLAAGADGLSVGDLFTAVWGGEFHPVRHENKVHVTLHRLRHWLGSRRPGAEEFVVLSSGRVRIAGGVDARVLRLVRRDATSGVAAT